jgi:hypothetical protein
MPLVRIPLFPLNMVLFPGNSLPLHIFEDRYKQMIRRSMDDRTPFGIVLATDDGLARIGCTAEVVQLLKTYDDGRMDIETVGLFPFRINEIHQENPLVEATVEPLEDDLSLNSSSISDSPEGDIINNVTDDATDDATLGSIPGAAPGSHTDAETAAEILDLYASCHALLHGDTPAPFDNLPGTALSYQIAGRLPLDLGVLQQLLEIRAEPARRAKLAERLREFLPQLAGIRQRQAKANTNGHGLH